MNPSPTQGRLCVVAAAILWSLSGAFTKILTKPTWFEMNEPPIETWDFGGTAFPAQIACYRVLFASLFLGLFLSKRDVSFRPAMLGMGLCFAAMNITFISANALGTAANAILLQYSAPLWIYLVSLIRREDPVDRHGAVSLALGMLGIGVILAGGWRSGETVVLALALVSGLTYGGAILFLRAFRAQSSTWLTVWNHGIAALALAPFIIVLRPPTFGQFIVLFVFGSVQMGSAYWLMARAVKSVDPHEAGILSLLEAILNPIWTYLVADESPAPSTFVGGAVILVALGWRYWPRRPS